MVALQILEIISRYMDEPEKEKLVQYYQFFKDKTSRAEKNILNAFNGPGEELYKKIQLQGVGLVPNLIYLSALGGRFEFTEKVEYYQSDPRDRIHFSSRERYEQFRREQIAKYWDDAMSGGIHTWDRGFRMLLFYHDVRTFLDKGVWLCADNPKTRREPFTAVKSRPAQSRQAFEAAYIFLSVGLYDRARYYIDILKHYLTIYSRSKKQSDNSWGRLFAAMTDCLMELVQAHQCVDIEQARRHASRAILAQFQAVAENWDSQYHDSTEEFKCRNLLFSLCIAAVFEFDSIWSKECCRTLLKTLSYELNYHPLFFKAMEWDAWMRMPEERGWISIDKLNACRCERWSVEGQKLYKKKES